MKSIISNLQNELSNKNLIIENQNEEKIKIINIKLIIF